MCSAHFLALLYVFYTFAHCAQEVGAKYIVVMYISQITLHRYVGFVENGINVGQPLVSQTTHHIFSQRSFEEKI